MQLFENPLSTSTRAVASEIGVSQKMVLNFLHLLKRLQMMHHCHVQKFRLKSATDCARLIEFVLWLLDTTQNNSYTLFFYRLIILSHFMPVF